MSKKDDLTRIEDLEEFVHISDSSEDNESESLPPIPEEGTETTETTEMEEAEGEKSEDIFGGEDEGHEVDKVDETDGPWETQETDGFFEGGAELPETPHEPEEEEGLEETLAQVQETLPEKGEEVVAQEEVAPQEEPTPLPPEDNPLKDIQKMTDRVAYGPLSLGLGPTFSVAVRSIGDEETKEELKHLLTEVGLDVGQFERGLSHGQILIGQINEYCAILLAHKLRNLRVDVEVGLSGEVHPSDSYDDEGQRGIPDGTDEGQDFERGETFNE
ncbi:MAG: hypothetical protein OXB88_05485 [Bacteriovoracales bacterium]|nr:hypothetical protein [Bacteriovoracales bacterium]